MNTLVWVVYRMSRIVLLMAILVLLASGLSFNKVDKEFETYFNFYQSIYNLNCDKHLVIPRQFGIIYNPNILKRLEKSTVVGRCIRLSNGMTVITINKEAWGRYDHDARTELIMHELTHCLMEVYEHSPDIDNFMSGEMTPRPDAIRTYTQLQELVKSECVK